MYEIYSKIDPSLLVKIRLQVAAQSSWGLSPLPSAQRHLAVKAKGACFYYVTQLGKNPIFLLRNKTLPNWQFAKPTRINSVGLSCFQQFFVEWKSFLGKILSIPAQNGRNNPVQTVGLQAGLPAGQNSGRWNAQKVSSFFYLNLRLLNIRCLIPDTSAASRVSCSGTLWTRSGRGRRSCTCGTTFSWPSCSSSRSWEECWRYDLKWAAWITFIWIC